MFAHFQDATTKTLIIGNCGVMRAKGTVEGTNTRIEKMRAPFNLKTKRLNVGGTKVTFNKIDFIERGKRHLHVASGIFNMCRVGFMFSLEEMSKGRRIFAVVHAFVEGNVLGSLDLACLNIFAMCVLHGLRVSQKDSWMGMCINFSISRVSREGTDTTTKCAKEREIGPASSAQFKH